MLVLSRRKNESIIIGEVEVTVVEVRGDRVRLGIEAGREHSVCRREVLAAIAPERVPPAVALPAAANPPLSAPRDLPLPASQPLISDGPLKRISG